MPGGGLVTMFNTIPVDSEMLSRVAYDHGVLYATFRAGNRTYAYFDVPADLFIDLINADSLGRFFQRHIIDKYRYTEL